MGLDMPYPDFMTKEEWEEFNALSAREDLNGAEETRWSELYRKARVWHDARTAAHEAEWKEFRALYDRVDVTDPARFTRYLDLGAKFTAPEALDRYREERAAKRRKMVPRIIFGLGLGYLAVVVGVVCLLKLDERHEKAIRKSTEAKVAARFPGSKPFCIPWGDMERSMFVRPFVAPRAVSCDFEKDGNPPGIDAIVIRGTKATAYKDIEVQRTAREGVPVAEFDLP